jgi:prephenate dehydrogenase
MFQQVAIIGCGLMGGSLAMAIRQASLTEKIFAYSRSPKDPDLQKALGSGVLDKVSSNLQEVCQSADLVVLAVPVACVQDLFIGITPFIKPQTLIIDLGSTKQDVILAAKASLGEYYSHFVPCHPIAGKEKTGIIAGDAGLYKDKLVVLTPTEQTSDTFIHLAKSFWSTLGSRCTIMSAQKHDQAFAAISHLPHLLAFVLVYSIQAQDTGKDYLKLAGSGFLDSTRIAASSPIVWRDILHANQEAVRQQLHRFKNTLDHFESLLDSPQSLTELIQIASHVRQDI